ncbi:MAG: methylenetetrahydrofolate reductase C-terminal domain-containing protein [Nitrososphaerota archaeon]
MILTTKKPFEEVKTLLEPYRNLLVVGCGTCATESQTGGEAQVKEMAERLSKDKFVESLMVETPCDERIVRRDWRKLGGKEKNVEAILVLACGAGVQTLAETVGLPVYPGLNTQFIGKVERIGLAYERCRACGDCKLGVTAGVCPITLCAKGLMNGPCGGMVNGKCEVKGYVRDCAWYLIWKRLKDQGRLNLLSITQPARQYSIEAYPRGIDALPSHAVVKGSNPVLRPDETFETIQRAVEEVRKQKAERG